MISMTGYAHVEKTGKDLSISVEIRGYNNRFLEVYVNLPPFLSMLEGRIRDKVSSCCGRGKIEVFIRVREYNIPVNITINHNAAKSFYNAILDIAKEIGIKEEFNISDLLKIESILEVEKTRDDERYWQEMQPLLNEAMNVFCSEREREGKHTKDDIMSHLKMIESSLLNVTSFAPVIEQTLKNNIKARFSEMLGNQVDENRVLSETALLLLKYTISEELSRLSSHLSEFKAEAEKNTRPGKKLDFLSQEINREINTIGSKSAIIEVTNEVVSMKESLENIREQLRNIE